MPKINQINHKIVYSKQHKLLLSNSYMLGSKFDTFNYPSFNNHSLTLISTNQFTVMDHEDPHTHLATFYELVGTMGFQSGDLESVYMRLFPFSLAGKVK